MLRKYKFYPPGNMAKEAIFALFAIFLEISSKSKKIYPKAMRFLMAELYSISKLLGHANRRTTQIYAKIVDENKRKAVNLIPNL